jgi:hypothetical protein
MSRKLLPFLVIGALVLPPLAAATPHRASGTGILAPGCPIDPVSTNVYCPVFPIWFSLSAAGTPTAGNGSFRTQWRVPGRSTTIFRGAVQCVNAVGNAVVVGGSLTAPGILRSVPFVMYAIDNGAAGDLVSDLGLFPFEDPDLALLPVGFPHNCPTPGLLASIYGYQQVQSGSLVVAPGTL